MANIEDLLGGAPSGFTEAMHVGMRTARERRRIVDAGGPNEPGPWDGAFLVSADAKDVAERFRALADR